MDAKRVLSMIKDDETSKADFKTLSTNAAR